MGVSQLFHYALMKHLRRYLLAVTLFIGATALVSAAEPPPAIALLKPGEALTYRVGWGVLGHAGDMKVVASEEVVGGVTQTRVTTTSASRGFVRMLYSFDGEAQMFFDPSNGRLMSATAATVAKKARTKASIVFDYTKSEANYVDLLDASRNTMLLVPPDAHPVDLITSLIQTRVWALAVGESRDVLVLFDNDFYELKITAVREETIKLDKGSRKTVLLMPTMIGTPKGMFRRGGEVRVWVSADSDHLPLRFEVKLKVGTAFAVLTDYQPPTAAATAESASTAPAAPTVVAETESVPRASNSKK